MRHVLVPLLTREDISAIPTVVAFLKAVKPLSVVVMNNPSLGITSEAATADIDKQIADLEKSERDAAARRDYPAAQQFSEKIEDAKMRRQDALRDGWKSIPVETRYAAYDTLIAPFASLAPIYVANIPLTEDTDHDNFLTVLASMGKTWPEALPKQRWSLLYPQGAGEFDAPQAVQTVPVVGKANTVPKAETPVLEPREARKKELSTQYMKMKKVAGEYGIPLEKGKAAEAIEQILDREFPKAA